MTSFMCRLTGGHKFDDSKLITQQSPDDINQLWVINRCVKCGAVWIKLFPKNRYDGFFHCEQCGYETMTYRSKQAAVKAWNKRNSKKEK